MKNLIIITALLLVNIMQSHGQIVLQLQNFPTTGDQVVYDYYSADSTVNEGPGGANIIWDFSNINSPQIGTSQYFLSATTPNCLMENTGSFRWWYCPAGNNSSFYTSNSNYDLQSEFCGSWWAHGSSERCYSTTWKKMKFPFTYNDTLTSNFIYEYLFYGWSTTITNESGYDTTICDGFGTVIGLTGTSYNALRTRSTIFDTRPSFNNYPSSIFNNVYQIIYNWYTLSHKGPFASLKYTYQSNATNPLNYTSKIFEIQNSTSTTDNINDFKHNITLSNNFTNEELKINFNNSEFGNYKISVYTLNGKLIYVDMINVNSEGQSYNLAVNSFDSGIYIVRFEFANQYIGSNKFVRK